MKHASLLERKKEESQRVAATYQRRLKYGLCPDDYERLVDQQNGRCAICRGITTRLVVDHDHATGGVRGLLCNRCNVGIGMLGDDLKHLRAATRYLAKRLRKCARPDCPNPYFVARHGKQTYCSDLCAAWKQRQLKRDWWRRKGSVLRSMRARPEVNINATEGAEVICPKAVNHNRLSPFNSPTTPRQDSEISA